MMVRMIGNAVTFAYISPLGKQPQEGRQFSQLHEFQVPSQSPHFDVSRHLMVGVQQDISGEFLKNRTGSCGLEPGATPVLATFGAGREMLR